MLGFALVVMALVMGAHKEKNISPANARALMYGSFASFLSFTISLVIGVYSSLADAAGVQKVAQVGIFYFGLGFLIILVTLSSIVVNWIKVSSQVE